MREEKRVIINMKNNGNNARDAEIVYNRTFSKLCLGFCEMN